MIYANFQSRQLFMQMYWSFQDIFFFALGFHLFTAEIMQAESFTLVRNRRIPQNFLKRQKGQPNIILEICSMLWILELHKI